MQRLAPNEFARQQRQRVQLHHFRKPKVVAGEAGKAWDRLYAGSLEDRGQDTMQKDCNGLAGQRYWGHVKVSK